MNVSRRRSLLVVVALIGALAVAIPVLAASPSPASGPPGQAKPDKSAKPEKGAKGPEVPVTVTGTIVQTTDDQGLPAFTLTAGGKTWDLSAGPSWYWGDKNPLKPFVGKSATIAGRSHAGDTELDIETVDGKAIRAPGKPPWAGGPWVVGKIHPGWKDWMAGGKPGKGLGSKSAPGQLKDQTPEAEESPGS